jgi:F-type H+-transporting ATPase subunit a
LHEWKHVPTSDVNTTFGLALGVWFLMIFFGIKAKGLGGWLHEFFVSRLVLKSGYGQQTFYLI